MPLSSSSSCNGFGVSGQLSIQKKISIVAKMPLIMFRAETNTIHMACLSEDLTNASRRKILIPTFIILASSKLFSSKKETIPCQRKVRFQKTVKSGHFKHPLRFHFYILHVAKSPWKCNASTILSMEFGPFLGLSLAMWFFFALFYYLSCGNYDM